MVPRMDPALRPKLNLLDPTLPPRITPQQWWSNERRIVQWARNAAADGDPSELEEYMRMLHLLPSGANILREGQTLDRQRLPAMLDELDAEYDAVAQMLSLDPQQFKRRYDAWAAQLKTKAATNPCLHLIPGGIERLLIEEREVAAIFDSLTRATAPTR